MPIVNRLLDAFFRTLDAVDIARERIDRALGRAPRPEPWASEWAPTPGPQRGPATVIPIREAPAPGRPAPVEDTPFVDANKKKPSKNVKTGSIQGAKPKKKKKSTKPIGVSRKGSIDRKGADFDSPRARAIAERLKADGRTVVVEDAAHDGKRVLARVLWALDASEKAGSELGLTAADASALLAAAAGLEVFATNVARTCRDEDSLIVESEPDGRSKRYKLTAAGRAAAATLAQRPA